MPRKPASRASKGPRREPEQPPEGEFRRISLMIREDQHEALSALGVNVSGLIRDLVDDYLSEHTVTIAVSEQTRALYQKIVADTGSGDHEVEPYLRKALRELLDQKIREMEKLRKSL